MPQPEQNLKNHARFDPMFHGFLFIGALILLGATIYAFVRQPDWWGAVRLLGVLWAMVLMFKTRLYATLPFGPLINVSQLSSVVRVKLP